MELQLGYSTPECGFLKMKVLVVEVQVRPVSCTSLPATFSRSAGTSLARSAYSTTNFLEPVFMNAALAWLDIAPVVTRTLYAIAPGTYDSGRRRNEFKGMCTSRARPARKASLTGPYV